MPIPPEFLYEKSRYIENLMRHRFVYEVSRLLLLREEPEMVRVSTAEVDDAGIDLVMTCRHVTRHIQLKTLANKKTSNHYAIAESLGGMPGGCIVWICYDRETFRPLHYHLMGGRGNNNMRSLSHQPKAKKRSGGDREGYRKVKIKDAESQKITLGRLVEILFDQTPSIEDSELSRFSTLA
jgi:hypothetical protein